MYTKGYCNVDEKRKLKHADFDIRKAYMETCLKGTMFEKANLPFYSIIMFNFVSNVKAF